MCFDRRRILVFLVLALAVGATACQGPPGTGPDARGDDDVPILEDPEQGLTNALGGHVPTDEAAQSDLDDALLTGEDDSAAEPAVETGDDDAALFARLDERFLDDTTALVAIETWRAPDGSNEEEVLANLARIQDYLDARVAEWNEGLETLEIVPFEWREEAGGAPRWVFGYRLGDGPRKFSMITHMDTVPPGDADWQPFEARIEPADYRDGTQDFLVGRGTIDDKGPGVIALTVLETAAQRFDGTDALEDWTLEVTFDSAEETDMSTPYYISEVGAPELGIVFDAFWCVVAEKGIERPEFRIELDEAADGAGEGLRLVSLETPSGAANQIPDQAMIRIEGDAASLDDLEARVEEDYASFGYDDPEYRPAPLAVERVDGALVLTATVLGAQHGSTPYENRDDGANPLVSLTNYAAHLADEGELAPNAWTRMAQWVAWAWGTKVFGEAHPLELYRYDEIFEEGNGTTYAVTRLGPDEGELRLLVDIRYALGHHAEPWDGTSQGQLPGESVFSSIFDELVADFNALDPEAPPVSFTTRTADSPDVRDPESPEFLSVRRGFEDAMGYACPLVATGGGTDAKGHETLIAAGALFADSLGPPINFHGIHEAAPLDDLRDSASVLYHILLQEVASEE